MQKFQELKDLLASIEGDVAKFSEKGNKAAGGRIRKAMQEVKALAQGIRADVQAMKADAKKED
jgi:hypothetical protein